MVCPKADRCGMCLRSTVLLHHDIPVGFVRHGVLVRVPGCSSCPV